LSGQIRLLEDELGFSLFYRNSRGVEASANGQAFLEAAESLVNGLSALKDFARELRGKPGTAIRIGVHSGLVQSMVPRIVRALSRSGVKIRPDIVTATARRIHRLVHQRRLDIGLVIEGDAKDVPDKLIWDQLASSEVALLVPPTHPLAKRREPLPLGEICGLPLIVNEPRMGYGRALLAAFADRNLAPDIVADCDDLESLKSMIAAGGGIALMPRIAAEREIARGLLSAVPLDPPQTVSIQLLRSQDLLPPRLERFRGQFVKEIAEARWPTPRAKGGTPQRGAAPA
jgi:DNA-binding transcriptional LysR family regulator